jgi:enolase-phosphatase E1
MIRAIVTDIEGTTTSISFVHDVLFPYARRHMRKFITAQQQDAEVSRQIAAVSAEVGKALSLDETINQLVAWIDADKKITPLKAIQGILWESGFKNNDYRAHMYDDAAEHLKTWHEKGIKLYVYSSGSVKAQKLLYGYSDHGDLTPLFSGYFDTEIGAKREAGSYRHIVKALNLEASDILFLSDIKEELDAAREAGMHTYWLVRDQTPDQNATHPQVADFSAIELSAS